MISGIRGIFIWRGDDYIDVDVHGVTYQMQVSQDTFRMLGGIDALGKDVALTTSLQVRESSMTLFGFFRLQDRNAFHSLLEVDGVGPHLAMIVLAAYNVEELKSIIQEQRTDALTNIAGIGKAKALKLLHDLTL